MGLKRVCHMTSAHDSRDVRIFHKECVSLAKAGYDTTLVVPGKSFDRDNVKVIGVMKKSNSRLYRMLFMARLVYKEALAVNADIYHFHDPELLPYALKLKKKNKIVVYDSHEDVPRQILAKTWIPLKMRTFVSKRYEYYEKRIARKLDYIVTATDHIANIFRRYNCKAGAIKNYPLLSDIHCKNNDYNRRERILCYAGGITEQRGITQLVKMMEYVDAELQIAGAIEQEYKKELEQLPGWGKVKLLGYLSRSEINDLYNRSLIGLVVLKNTPNHRKALPIKMFEYMAAGIPIVASDFEVWKDIIERSECGISVDPEKVEDIGNAVNKLLADREASLKLGKNGREAICREYNWGIEEEKLVDIYSRLVC
ncbi:glycosyltransferase family 4 protein [[Clostridium] hylemonae]|uniref:glycosyltransferase family 4 protein n=1 Tax=[Clostridium] hylemonae TaxID=89153 RepID=UPI0011068206|nr:glycosyltransferase family 4 protein [[Clostridium] hylemonae]